MDFYRVIKKDKDCDVILSVFMSIIMADEYCRYKKIQNPTWDILIDKIKSGIELSKSFMGQEYDTI